MFHQFRTPLVAAVIMLSLAGIGFPDTGTGSISLTSMGVPISIETFDTLSNVAGSTTNTALPTGWYFTEGGGGARDNEQYAVDTGSSTTGDMYSYGAAGSTERAFGQLRSGTLIPLFGAKFTNNTGSTITALSISYTGEEWRLGTAGRTDQMNFEYSLNATDLSTGTYTPVPALNFVTPDTATVGAKNGNAAADRTAISSTISGLSIPDGATFFIRWNDQDASGADDGLAIDDFTLTPMNTTAAAVLVSGRVLDAGRNGMRNVRLMINMQDGSTVTAITNAFGYYRFDKVPSGATYIVQAQARGFRFTPRAVTVNDAITDLDFTPQ